MVEIDYTAKTATVKHSGASAKDMKMALKKANYGVKSMK